VTSLKAVTTTVCGLTFIKQINDTLNQTAVERVRALEHVMWSCKKHLGDWRVFTYGKVPLNAEVMEEISRRLGAYHSNCTEHRQTSTQQDGCYKNKLISVLFSALFSGPFKRSAFQNPTFTYFLLTHQVYTFIIDLKFLGDLFLMLILYAGYSTVFQWAVLLIFGRKLFPSSWSDWTTGESVQFI
jgi:hypothetical protein